MLDLINNGKEIIEKQARIIKIQENEITQYKEIVKKQNEVIDLLHKSVKSPITELSVWDYKYKP